jgi:SAM-dependent methyltransferase
MPKGTDVDAELASRLAAATEAGTREHYEDALLYDHEYRRRRADVAFYRRLVADELAARKRRARPDVVELGCGTGRLLLPLAKDGWSVVGVDASRPMLDRLEERLAALPADVRQRVRTVEADFRALRLGVRAPIVLSPFNAMMHLYTRTDVELFLDGVRRTLAPGGLFAFDVMCPDLRWLSRDPEKRWSRTRFRHPRTGRPMIYSTSLTYDGPLQIAFMRIFYEPADGKGRTRTVHLTHRYFFPQELEALLHYNGFGIESVVGDFDGAPLEPGSEYQVVRARARR